MTIATDFGTDPVAVAYTFISRGGGIPPAVQSVLCRSMIDAIMAR
jgi:hypothetical protein